ncbi:hypothetical protein DDD_2870 [Nonlabens dokdonensis DSW-6]|jgi:hypothetical protein|uniref:Uncharacterized protein n=1 Tax=Nonlabens dokdonensis (strain DSM 17205 / KCTC 12402 / DSW-6) TaxID=592029 RepID=L7WCM6_NONDD|nr:hypothetical protein DDD_2870 [Nonlabens dokdonensis DSW-6]
MIRFLKHFIYFLSFLSLPFSFSLLSFYIKASNHLGYYPKYNNPDPKELELYSFYSPWIEQFMLIWTYSFLTWFFLMMLYLFIKKSKIDFYFLIITALFQMIPISILFSGIFEWYVD